MGFEAGSTFGDDLFICTNFSPGCEGDMTIGTPQTCTIDNVLVSTPTETLTVIKNTDCQADPEVCEQNPIQSSQFTIVIEGNDPSQNNFPGSSTGTDVELEAGPYSVTEQDLKHHHLLYALTWDLKQVQHLEMTCSSVPISLLAVKEI